MLILLPPSEKKSQRPGPAITVYAGVLYTALDWVGLTKQQQQVGIDSIAIISAKYGVLKPTDQIEPYKEKINNKKMAGQVARSLDVAESELIIDCRSSTYQTVWRAPYAKTVEIKVFTRVNGIKKVITHMSKKTRGEVVREILTASKKPQRPQDVQDLIAHRFECELLQSSETGPWILEVYC